LLSFWKHMAACSPAPNPLLPPHQPRTMMKTNATIESLGHRGEGIAIVDGRKVFVHFALPGEEVELDVEGDRGTLLAVQTPSPDRAPLLCPHFGLCGGCQLQHLNAQSYAAFKT